MAFYYAKMAFYLWGNGLLFAIYHLFATRATISDTMS